MRPSLIRPFVNENVVLSIQGDPKKYIGRIILLEDGGIILQNDRYGKSSFDCRCIMGIQTDIKRQKKCEELPEKEHQ